MLAFSRDKSLAVRAFQMLRSTCVLSCGAMLWPQCGQVVFKDGESLLDSGEPRFQYFVKQEGLRWSDVPTDVDSDNAG